MEASGVVRAGWALARRALWPFVVAALGLAVGWLKVWSPVVLDAAAVERGTVTREAFGRGTIESQREVAVGFDLVGRLSDVLVEEGARVTLGQELARLETNQARADLKSAQTGVAAARASLQRIAADEDRARAVLSTAERDAARGQTLFESKVFSSQQRDEANDRLRVARADLDRVLAQRAEATRGIDVASGGAEQRRVAMVRATLLAPIDGLVIRRLREPGDTVTVGSTVLRIVDTHHVHINAAVDETVLSLLAVDQPATIVFPGVDTPMRGKVARIPWESDRQTHELLVEVAPEKLERRVAIGQRADVRIELERRDNTLRIPLAFLHQDATGPYAVVDREGRTAVVRLTLGVSGRDVVEVLTGLSLGDTVLKAVQAGAAVPFNRRWVAP